MGQRLKTEFICDARYRIHSVWDWKRKRDRIIEIEDVDLQKRFYGTPSKLEQMASTLREAPRRSKGRSLRGGP